MSASNKSVWLARGVYLYARVQDLRPKDFSNEAIQWRGEWHQWTAGATLAEQERVKRFQSLIFEACL